MQTKQLRQVVTFRAPVSAVYGALMDSRRHSRITESRAVIGRRAGSAFSVWGGGVTGVTVALSPNKRIVQAWRGSGWPDGHYSIAVFTFRKAGKGTQLVFEQYGIPSGELRDIADGWRNYYWQPMKTFFER